MLAYEAAKQGGQEKVCILDQGPTHFCHPFPLYLSPKHPKPKKISQPDVFMPMLIQYTKGLQARTCLEG